MSLRHCGRQPSQSCVLALDKVAFQARGVRQVVHVPLSDGAILGSCDVVTKVATGGVTELGNDLLGGSGINRAALAPTVGTEQTSGAVDAVIDVILGHAVFLVVAHVVPDGKCTTDHLRIASGNRVPLMLFSPSV